MTPNETTKKDLDEKHVELIGKLVCDIRNGKLRDNLEIAQATVRLLEQIINESQNPTAYGLLGAVRAAGRRLGGAAPRALVATNMVRRVLRAIRDEQRMLLNQSGEVAGESLQRLVLATSGRRSTLSASTHDLREQLRDHIAELHAELESSQQSLCSAGARLLRGEVVLVGGAGGALAEAFVLAAHARAPLRVLLPGGSDAKQSGAMAARLAAAGVPVTVISNAAVFAVMCRVNKVVVCVAGALVGGAVLAAAGTLALTQAAKYYNVPVLALAPLYQLSPLQAADPSEIPLAAPGVKHHYMNAECIAGEACAPLYDYIQPDHISLFITNLGGSSPSYIYRLLSELYDPLDHVL